jgi:hypothetical protein
MSGIGLFCLTAPVVAWLGFDFARDEPLQDEMWEWLSRRGLVANGLSLQGSSACMPLGGIWWRS